MRITILIAAILLSGCASTLNHTSLANGENLLAITDKSFGGDSASVVSKAMSEAQKKCGDKKVEVITISNTGMQVGTFPTATLRYKCE